MTNRKIQYWVVSPKADSEFIASMKEVLDTYAMPYNESIPVMCMDEQPVQLLKETRPSIRRDIYPEQTNRSLGNQNKYKAERG